MKRIIHISTCLFVFALVSCKKSFLEITPKGKLIAQTTSDYNLLLTNLDLVNISATAHVPMGDEVAGVDPYFSGTDVRTQRLFHWDDVIYEPDQNASELTGPLASIYLFNKVISEVTNSTEGTEQEKKSIKAQAMAGRAWTYFLLINYYGKPYNASTAATDPGFPIITAADVTESKFTRASVKEVYDFIVNDLSTAIPDLPAKTTHRLRMSRAAGEAILGKVYVFMGNYSDAITPLSNSIAANNNAAIPVRLYDYNETLSTGGSFLPIGIFGPSYPTVPNNYENVYAKQFINNWAFFNNELVITPQTVALYGASDHRLKFYSNSTFGGGSVYPAGMLRRIGPIAVQFGVVVPDVYLLLAEAKARSNDLAGAVADIEVFRENRMPVADAAVPSAIASNQTDLVRFILEERLREFAMQGFRWFDMRRLSVDPTYSSTVGTTHNVYSGTGTITGTHTLRPERLVLRFPQLLIDQNPGMQNND